MNTEYDHKVQLNKIEITRPIIRFKHFFQETTIISVHWVLSGNCDEEKIINQSQRRRLLESYPRIFKIVIVTVIKPVIAKTRKKRKKGGGAPG